MFLAWFGANAGASSITTRPLGSSMYSVLSGSSGRQSAGFDALRSSPTLGLGGSSFGVAPACAGQQGAGGQQQERAPDGR